MKASDVHLARGEAKETVMASMAHVKLPTNGNKQYELDELLKVLKTVKRILTETFDELNANGKEQQTEVQKGVAVVSNEGKQLLWRTQ
jgi:hypothetical protein